MSRDRSLILVSALAALAAVACSSDPDPNPDATIPPAAKCEDDPRADTFIFDFTRTSANGLFTVHLAHTTPAMPSRGDNTWDLEIIDAAGTTTIAANVRLKAWMPEHQHGTDPLWTEATPNANTLRHRAGPFDLFMNGLWELTIEATLGGVTDQATMAFCISEPAAEHDAGVAPEDAGLHDAGAPVVCNVTAPTDCPTPVRYVDVEPIFMARCWSCHDGRGDQWALTSYDHAADWFDTIRSQMLACTMPPPDSGLTMLDSEREQLLMWIRCGFRP